VASTAFPIGDGTFGTSLSIQHLETTVSAEDGETVLLGGLITKSSDKNEAKVPWLGDLPGVGALFRYRTEVTSKTELLIIMTPHIVRNRQEAECMLAQEARRIDWALGDVMRVHGTTNCSPFMPDPAAPGACKPGAGPANPVQPYRIIPGPQPNGYQGQLPPSIPVGPPSWSPPVPRSMPVPNAAGASNGAPAPPATLNLNGSAQLPGVPVPGWASVDVPTSGAPLGQAGPGAAPPARLPQDPQMQAAPVNTPFVMPAQTNYYDKAK
jgi:hypothetical protein